MRRWRGFVDEILRGAPFLRQGRQNDGWCGDDEAGRLVDFDGGDAEGGERQG